MKKLLLSAMLATAVSANMSQALADLITFDFTGRMTLAVSDGSAFQNVAATGILDPWGFQTPISASLTFDTSTGFGSSNLVIDQINLFYHPEPAVIHDISFTRQQGTNIINGSFLFDGGGLGNSNIGYIQWDATGMINAINYGLQIGDKISGAVLYRDFNADHQYEISEIAVSDLGSAIPYSDYGLHFMGPDPNLIWYPNQGPAPMAATMDTVGFATGTNLEGLVFYLDIGSGNSMYVTSIQTVPVPSAIWLFGTGLLGLIGLARRKA